VFGDAIALGRDKKFRMLPDTCSSIDNEHKKSIAPQKFALNLLYAYPVNFRFRQAPVALALSKPAGIQRHESDRD
jgi:hypothetical protein